MTENVFFDVLPVSTIELNPTKEKKYFTSDAFKALDKNPNRWMLLGGGAPVDKAYLPVLESQAHKHNPEIRLYFNLEDRGVTITKSGSRSYYYKGRVFASNGYAPLPGEATAHEATEPKKMKNKNKKKNKSKNKES
ncbi:MAG: hypothetical protein ACTH30_10595 [Leucobacter sp.]